MVKGDNFHIRLPLRVGGAKLPLIDSGILGTLAINAVYISSFVCPFIKTD